MYEWRLKDGNPSASRDFVLFMGWIKSARGVSKSLLQWLSDGNSLSVEEENSLCDHGRDILSYFSDALQSLDWTAVGNDLPTEDREAGRFVHSFSYNIRLLVVPLIVLRNHPDQKFDVISPQAVSALESAWQTVKRTHPNVDIAITRHRLKRPLATASHTLDSKLASLRGLAAVPESPPSISPAVILRNYFVTDRYR